MEKIPDANDLRKKAKELEGLEDAIAKHIIKAVDEGSNQLKLNLSYDDGDLNYFGKNKEMMISLLESKNYEVELIPRTILSGGFETYPEGLRIDWS